MASALFLFAALLSRASFTPVDVTIKVAVLSGVDVKPVALKKFSISGSSGDLAVRTNEQGVISTSLEPGKYHLKSIEPLNLGTALVEWDYAFDVTDGKAVNLVVTNEDGITKKVETPVIPANNGGVAPETLLYRKFRNSVATVIAEGATGTGFLIDSAGLYLTNAHVVEGSKRFRIKIGPGKVYKAELVQTRPLLDVAVLRVSPDIVKDLPVIPLLQSTDKQPEEGERVIAIGCPLHQQTIMTTGIVSKVEKNVIISDVNINHGNSGGPLFDMQGRAIGVTTFADGSTQGGPGISGIVSIGVARELIADIKSNLVAISAPAATEMPDLPDLNFLETSVDPSTIKKPIDPTRLNFPRLFNTTIDTPIWRLSRQAELARHAQKQRRGKETVTVSSDKFWEQYVGQKNFGYVSISAIPQMAETSGSALSHALFGKLAGKSKMEIRFDFRDMELYADGQLIEPVTFTRSHYVWDAENDYAYINDTATAGYFTYRFDAFDPAKKYTLRIRKEEDPNKWDETKIDPKIIKRIYDSFVDVRKAMGGGS